MQGVKGTDVGQAERSRRYRAKHPERVKAQMARQPSRQYGYERKSLLKRRYGITLERFDAILDEQSGACGICATDTPGGRGTWHVDHDHSTGVVRGLLCWKCNQGLGYFQDDESHLFAAIDYLRRH